MQFRLGLLRHRVTLQRRTTNYDDLGQESPAAFANVQTVSACVKTLSGRELEQARQVYAEASLIVTLRYLSGLTTKDRFLFGSRVIHIGAAVDPEERRRWLVCYCKEEV